MEWETFYENKIPRFISRNSAACSSGFRIFLHVDANEPDVTQWGDLYVSRWEDCMCLPVNLWTASHIERLGTNVVPRDERSCRRIPFWKSCRPFRERVPNNCLFVVEYFQSALDISFYRLWNELDKIEFAGPTKCLFWLLYCLLRKRIELDCRGEPWPYSFFHQ